MEDVKNVETKETKKKKNKIWLVVVLFILIIIGFYFFRKINKTEDIGFKVKSSLDKIVEKSDLETINITYNVIAKKCQDNEECNQDKNMN